MLAIFADALGARVVAPRRADTHLLAENLSCAVLCNDVYIRQRTRVQVGTITGAVCRPVDVSVLFEEYADALAGGTPLYALLAEVEYEDEDEAEAPEDEPVASPFRIEWPDAHRRLAAWLPSSTVTILDGYMRRNEGGTVLWIDTPWAELDDEPLEPEASVALAVFAAPLECQGPLALTQDQLIGGGPLRNATAYVFLDAVRAGALTTVPDTLAVFAGGVSVEGAACFSAADADSFVYRRLRARTVISGCQGDSWVTVSRWCSVDVGTLVGRWGATRVGVPVRRLEDAYPRWRDQLDDGARVWECFMDDEPE